VTDVKVAPDRTPAREGDAPATTDRRGKNSSTRRKDLTNALALWRFGALALWRFGALALWRFGALALWRFGA